MAQTLRSGVGAGDEAQHTENGNHGGRTIADQGQGQADNGHNADTHTHVDQDLEHQGGGRTEADQTAHIVGALSAHIDAPGDDGQLQHHNQNTAEEAHFLADGGEDVVRVLGEQVAALGTVAVEQALACQTAAGKGLQIDLGVVAGTGALGIEAGVNEDQDSLSLILAQELPQNGQHGGNTADGQGKPPQADTAGKGHADEDEHEDQGNAHVGRKHQIQAHQQSQVEHHVHDRGDAGDPVLVGRHDRSHDQDIGDFTNFRRLYVEGQQGEVQPASVTGVVVGAEGDQQKQHENIEGHHQVPVFLEKFHVHRGEDGVDHHADEDGQQLDHDVADIAAEFFGRGGAGDDNDAQAGGNKAQDQQDHVAFFKEIFQFVKKLAQMTASFPFFRCSIPLWGGKVNRTNVNAVLRIV